VRTRSEPVEPTDRLPRGPAGCRPARQPGSLARAWATALGLWLGLGVAWAQGASTGTPQAQAATIFACGPEWAALTRVLMPAATLHVATHARQDPHHIEARPALIAQLRRADATICTGAGLEDGWLPTLQQRAGNPRVRDGEPGMFLAASAVTLIDARPGSAGNPFAGDVHEQGNPHLHADPRKVLEVARAWALRLQQLFPDQAPDIARRQKAFESDWLGRIEAWSQRAEPLRGMELMAQHTSFAYLWAWLGVRQTADLEPRPGLAPTPGHLQGLLAQWRQRPGAAIVVGQHQDPRAARWLSQQLGGRVPVLQWPATVDDPEGADALGRWIDALVDALLAARRAAGSRPAESQPR
jgi:zinc/manganese transport system substrate-binding protein